MRNVGSLTTATTNPFLRPAAPGASGSLCELPDREYADGKSSVGKPWDGLAIRPVFPDRIANPAYKNPAYKKEAGGLASQISHWEE